MPSVRDCEFTLINLKTAKALGLMIPPFTPSPVPTR
jgi:hypothetical protein